MKNTATGHARRVHGIFARGLRSTLALVLAAAFVVAAVPVGAYADTGEHIALRGTDIFTGTLSFAVENYARLLKAGAEKPQPAPQKGPTDSGFFGIDSSVKWDLAADGTLTISPTNGSFGRFNKTNGFSGESFTAAANWPWHSYRSNITKVVVTAVIEPTNNTNLSYMFADCANLTSVDLTGLNPERVRHANNMFENCIKLAEITMPEYYWFKTDDPNNRNNLSRMFSECQLLKSIDVSRFRTNNADQMLRMFYRCAALESIDLSAWENEGVLYNVQRMFENCASLKSVVWNNPNFKTRAPKIENGKVVYSPEGCQFYETFAGCYQLEYVDMSNITVGGRSDGMYGFGTASVGTGITKGLFDSLPGLKTVKMENIHIIGMKSLSGMFAFCSNLESVTLTPAEKLVGVETTAYMFGGYRSGRHENAEKLKTIVLDGFDNSDIGAYNGAHSIADYESREDAIKYGAMEFASNIGLILCPNLETLSARNSKIWAVKNSAGIPGSEYFLAANDSDITWWWMGYDWNHVLTAANRPNGRQLEFTSDVSGKTYTLNKRDYVDLITDRDGKPEHMPTLNGLNYYPDASTSINMVDGDLNPNGMGFLAPGVYRVLNTKWENTSASMPYTDFRIAYLDEHTDGVPYTVLVNGDEVVGGVYSKTIGELVIFREGNNVYVNTVTKGDWPTEGSYTIKCGENGNPTIDIIYFDAAGDNAEARELENRKDVRVSIKEITFTNLDRIPLYSDYGDTGREHDYNKYVDNMGGQYCRTVLQVKKDGLEFYNYLSVGAPENSSIDKALSGGAGTDIDFEISLGDMVEGGNLLNSGDWTTLEGATFAYYVNDLDVPDRQVYVNEVDRLDGCFDYLYPYNVHFGVGSEGFILGDGNDLSTVLFADHTGLALVNDPATGKKNYVVPTGSDPSTSWSDFSVVADSAGAKYRWTSGVGCTTYALRNTPRVAAEDKYIVYDFSNRISHSSSQVIAGESYEFTLPSYALSVERAANRSPVDSADCIGYDYRIKEQPAEGSGEPKKTVEFTFDIKGISPDVLKVGILMKCDPNHPDNELEVEYQWLNVCVIPATNVHYEESYLSYNPEKEGENPFAADWDDDDSTAVNPVWDATDGTIIGEGAGRQSDANALYGFDATYAGFAGDSNGRSMHVQVGEDAFNKVSKQKTHQWPALEFTFTGTGFDLIGRAGLNTGVYVVNVYNSSNEAVVSQIINTRYYGASYQPELDGEQANVNVGSDMRQVPIVHINKLRGGADMPHDTYTVRVQFMWSKGFAKLPKWISGGNTEGNSVPGAEPAGGLMSAEKGGMTNFPGIPEADYEFIGFEEMPDEKANSDMYIFREFDVYVDAIRVYNPIKPEDITDGTVVYDAYVEAGELDPEYIEIRNIITGGGAADNSAFAIDVTPHYVYQMEGDHVVVDENGNPVPVLDENGKPKYIMPQGSDPFTSTEYKNYGPNNEVYLKNGNIFGFKVNDYASIRELHISAKAPCGSTNMQIFIAKLTEGSITKALVRSVDIDTATEMYYDLSPDKPFHETVAETFKELGEDAELYVMVAYGGSENAILSVGEIKLVRDPQAPAEPTPNIVADENTAELATALIAGRKGDVNADGAIDMMDALLTMRQALSGDALGIFGRYCGDADENGFVDMMDSVIIIRDALA